MRTIFLIILLSQILLRFSPAKGSKIVGFNSKLEGYLVNKTLDELLSLHPNPCAVYFTRAGEKDESDGFDLVSNVLIPLTDFPRLLDIFLINCDRPMNKDDCSKYDSKVPELRLFPTEFKRMEEPSEKGLHIPNKSAFEMRDFVLNKLMRMKLKQPGHPNFEPILSTDTIDSLFQQADNKNITHVVLVDQSEKGSTVGRDTILALLPREDVMVRIVNSSNLFANFGLDFQEKDKKLAVINRSQKSIKLLPKQDNGKHFAQTVIEFLKSIANKK